MKTSTSSALLHTPGSGVSFTPARGFEMRRVATRDDWNEARALRYAALIARGEIAAAGDRSYGDPYDQALNTLTFVLTRNRRTLGSTRSAVSSANRRWALPAMEVFEREIHNAIGVDSTIVEASLTVVAPDSPMDPKTALFHLFKAHMVHCASENADWFLVAVRDTQIGFYRRMFNMEILSGAERYPGLGTPRVLMGMDYRAQARLLFKRIPVLAVSDDDERDFAASGVITFGNARQKPIAQPSLRWSEAPR
jgi:hypothetical protein